MSKSKSVGELLASAVIYIEAEGFDIESKEHRGALVVDENILESHKDSGDFISFRALAWLP